MISWKFLTEKKTAFYYHTYISIYTLIALSKRRSASSVGFSWLEACMISFSLKANVTNYVVFAWR